MKLVLFMAMCAAALAQQINPSQVTVIPNRNSSGVPTTTNPLRLQTADATPKWFTVQAPSTMSATINMVPWTVNATGCVYNTASGALATLSIDPTCGLSSYWQRSGTTVSLLNSGDNIGINGSNTIGAQSAAFAASYIALMGTQNLEFYSTTSGYDYVFGENTGALVLANALSSPIMSWNAPPGAATISYRELQASSTSIGLGDSGAYWGPAYVTGLSDNGALAVSGVVTLTNYIAGGSGKTFLCIDKTAGSLSLTCPSSGGGFSSGAWTSFTTSTTFLSSTTITGGYNSYGKTMFLRVGITGTFSGSGAQVPLITVPTQPVDSTETFSCIVSLAGVIIPCSVTNTSGTTYQVKFYNNSAWANGSTYTIGITGSYETI